jgi:Lrp/AsnC family leucine-responsive transcriptional regulator
VDDLDAQIVRALVTDARLTFQQLAALVHLSPTSTAERVRRLQRTGTISGYHAQIDLTRIGYSLRAVSDVKLKETTARTDFEAALDAVPEVQSAIHTTGEFDYQLELVTAGTDGLEGVIDTLRRIGVRECQTRIVLGTVRYDPTRLL